MQRVTVWTRDCGKVRMTTSPSQDSDMYWDIPTGAQVNVLEIHNEWSKVSTGDQEGYILTKHLMLGDIMFNTEDDTIIVDRKRLECVYDKLGDILGIRE